MIGDFSTIPLEPRLGKGRARPRSPRRSVDVLGHDHGADDRVSPSGPSSGVASAEIDSRPAAGPPEEVLLRVSVSPRRARARGNSEALDLGAVRPVKHDSSFELGEDVDPADRLGPRRKPWSRSALRFTATIVPSGVDHPDADRQVVQHGLDLRPARPPPRSSSARTRRAAARFMRLAVLLELADRLGGRLVDHLSRRPRSSSRSSTRARSRGGGRSRRRRGSESSPEMAELGDDLGDVVALAPAMLPVLLPGLARCRLPRPGAGRPAGRGARGCGRRTPGPRAARRRGRCRTCSTVCFHTPRIAIGPCGRCDPPGGRSRSCWAFARGSVVARRGAAVMAGSRVDFSASSLQVLWPIPSRCQGDDARDPSWIAQSRSPKAPPRRGYTTDSLHRMICRRWEA